MTTVTKKNGMWRITTPTGMMYQGVTISIALQQYCDGEGITNV